MYKDNQIIHGDCHEILKSITHADLIITDPPYKIDNTTAGGNSNLSKSMQNMNDELEENELNIDLGIEWCKEVPRIQKKINIYIWCNKAQIIQYLDYFVKELGCSFDIILWKKTNAMPTFNNKYLTDKEYCLYFRKGGYCNPQNYNDAKTVWELPININDKNRYGHPTIKPKQIIDACIRNSSKEGDVILDMFAGSGTTGERAYLLNRKFILIEKSLKFYNVIKKRIDLAMGKVVVEKKEGQTTLF